MEELKVEPSEDLAYWIGVSQADGYLKHFRGSAGRLGIEFGVGEKSLPMIHKFKDISKRVFHRDYVIWKDKRGFWRHYFSVKSLMQSLQELQISITPVYRPPIWAINKKFFGAYLAGLIDGDGDIRIKRPKYPQCVIRITSGLMQDFLQKQLETLGIIVSQTRRHHKTIIKGRFYDTKWVALEFYVSRRIYQFLLQYVIPEMAMEYKKKKLLYFIRGRLEN